ncbi:ATP-dependent helicase, partial [Streptomyces sp. NPDC057101]
RSGEEELHRITGARTPSGIPVTITAPAPEPRRPRGTTTRGRRGPAAAARRAGARRSAVDTAA